MSAPLAISVDPGKAFSRKLSDLEAKQLPFATMMAINATAFETRQRWAEAMPEVFDRPTALTLGAVLYTKASKQQLVAQVYIRDQASGGTSPAQYLLAEVDGGQRRRKGLDVKLTAAGILPAGMYAVPGKGASLNAHGNLDRSQVRAILSQLGAMGVGKNETEAAAGRRRRRAAKTGDRNGEYFVAHKGKLPAGIFRRVNSGFGSAVRSVLYFTRKAVYRRRYPIAALAQQIFAARFPVNFEKQLAAAVASSWGKAFK